MDIFQIARLFSEAGTDDIILITASKIKLNVTDTHTSVHSVCTYGLVYAMWGKKYVKGTDNFFARNLSIKFTDISFNSKAKQNAFFMLTQNIGPRIH